MRNIVSFLIITLLAFGLTVNEASAKRFGGGRSFGTYRSVKSFSSFSAKKPVRNTSSANKWGGVVGGLLMGGLLASLFMNHGLAGGLLSWLVVGSVLFFIMSFLRKRMQPGFQSTQNYSSAQEPFKAFKPDLSFNNFGATLNTPRGFSSDEFLRDTKVMFIRLQAAYDTKNLADLSEFTSPEVLAEIKLQFQEREEEYNHTEVVTLDAELLDVSLEETPATASVRFTGLIKENSDVATPLNEIWHFRQTSDSSKWIVNGVQQDKPF